MKKCFYKETDHEVGKQKCTWGVTRIGAIRFDWRNPREVGVHEKVQKVKTVGAKQALTIQGISVEFIQALC